jgi:undecaprenyl-diphosphatase
VWYLALATIPGAVAGKLLDEWAETAFRSPGLVALMMALMGLVLWAADRRAGSPDEDPGMPLAHALLIGMAQALAIVPGTSRSGATISMALFLGHSRESAARFSFLLALPITFGAAFVKVPQLAGSTADPSTVLVGMAAAAVSGFLAIRLLLAHVRTKDYTPFVHYRFAFAALVWVLLLVRHGYLG